MPYQIAHTVIDKYNAEYDYVPEDEQSRVVMARLTLRRPLTDQEFSMIPRTLIVEVKSRWDHLPDLYARSTGPYFFSPRLKDLVESLEPSVHRYIEVQIESKIAFKGTTKHGPYYLLLPPPEVDCIEIHGTTFAEGHAPVVGSDGKVAKGGYLTDSPTDPCAMRARDIAGHHLWFLPSGWDDGLFCSDQLWEAMAAAKIRGWMILKRCTAV